METSAGTCPGCHKHCDLSKPRCRVGKQYALEGLPTSDRSKKAEKGAPVSEEERLAKSLIHAGKAMKHADKPRGERFGALTAEEKALFAALLQKVEAGIEADAEASSGGHKGHGHHGGHHGH